MNTNKTNKKSTNKKITLNYTYTPAVGYTDLNPTIYTTKYNTLQEALEFIEFHPRMDRTISSIKYQINTQNPGGWTTKFLY